MGLGNPGAEYENTRHNVGYLVIEELIRRVAAKVKSGNGEYLFARTRGDDQDIVLVKPLTYMNNSGEAVAAALQDFGTPIDRLLVVVDDIALQLGRLRLRPGGSAGGHNGLGSIISTLDTNFFARLRCGIGTPEPPPGELLANFVLSPFAREEQQEVRSMIKRAGDAAMSLLESGVSRTMNMFNE